MHIFVLTKQFTQGGRASKSTKKNNASSLPTSARVKLKKVVWKEVNTHTHRVVCGAARVGWFSVELVRVNDENK